MPDTCKTCGCKLGRTAKTPIDRSLGFTAMLELYPGFGQMPGTEGMGITTAFLADWYGSNHTDMWAYAREWVAARQAAARTTPEGACKSCGYPPERGRQLGCTACLRGEQEDRAAAAEARQIAEHTSPPEPGTAGHEPVYGPNADGNPYAQYTPEYRAWRQAQDNGKAAASWVFDGSTGSDVYRRVLAGIETGDPAVLDGVREPSLNGEYGDDYSEELLMRDVGWVPSDGTDLRDALATQYNQEVSEAFWHEIERLARQHLSTAEGR